MKKRYFVYFFVLMLGVQTVWAPLRPPLPVIQLPGEIVAFRGAPIFGGLTNTFVAALLTFAIIVFMALSLRAKSRTADEIPSGFYNFFEMMVEGLFGYVQDSVGSKWAKQFFPFFMTFILWIVIANWMELIPGVDAIGIYETMGEVAAHKAEEKAEVAAAAAGHHLSEDELHHIGEEAEEAAMEQNIGHQRKGLFLVNAAAAKTEAEKEASDYTIVPFVRAAATDLNFTLAIALISVIFTQYYGMKAQGMKYWSKFFNWPADRIKKDPLAILDPAVGLLEFISEIFKIVSFAFRLLGNIFAGQVLLFVIGSLAPIGNLLFWHLEFGVGALQGFVFALLTLTFMKGAVESHH